jgi:hypothetical protein
MRETRTKADTVRLSGIPPRSYTTSPPRTPLAMRRPNFVPPREATPSSDMETSSDVAVHSGKEGTKGSKKRHKQCPQGAMTDHGDDNDGKVGSSGVGRIDELFRLVAGGAHPGKEVLLGSLNLDMIGITFYAVTPQNFEFLECD